MLLLTALTPTLPPRLVSPEAAAAHVCVSTMSATGNCRKPA